jgi:hypothetical protein
LVYQAEQINAVAPGDNMSKILVGIFSFALAVTTCNAQTEAHKADQAIEVGKERIVEGQAAQEKIDKIGNDTGRIVGDYTEVLKVIDGLDLYNRLLQKQLDSQNGEMSILHRSIANTSVVERQISPLLNRMINDLGRFIKVDMPFLLDERQARVNKLKKLMVRSDLTLAEKSRRVFEAFQIENDYGRTIEAYKGQLEIDSNKLDVEFLRIGRIALVYRDLSGTRTGVWDSSAKNWQAVSGSQYKRYMIKGLKIARQEMAPELLTIPLIVNKEVR